MARKPIPVEQFILRPFRAWDAAFLLTAGDFMTGHFNTMTVGWGSFGFIWGRPFALVVVRPVRYTYQFMERYDSFTLCAFSEAYRDALDLLGSKSGREGDKIKEAGLKPVGSTVVAAPCFAEAELVVECRKIYWSDLDPSHFLDLGIEQNYPHRDYHRIYFGEILAVMAEDAYRVP